MPWCAFALYAHVALARALGVVGVVEAAFVSVAALPFWRALCRRPAFQPLAALLRRFHAKRRLHPFEETREDDTRGDGEPLGFRLDWRVGFEKRVPDAQAELAAFVAEHARGDAPREASETTRVRDPASRLVASGFRVFPLCDETLVAPNAAAARHFPATCAAVRAAGGFGARLWVLSPETNHAGARTRGVSDGYWRAHVVLARDAGLHGKAAGLRSGDETRALEVGSVHVVNDYHPSAFWNVSRDAGVVLLSFDVARPELDSCRAALVESRARLTRAFGATSEEYNGDVTFMAYLWRAFSLTLISNLS